MRLCPRKIARNPASSRSESHWKERGYGPRMRRRDTGQRAPPDRMRRSNFPRAKPVRNSMAEKTMPAKQSPTSVVSSAANQNRLGTARKRSAEPVRSTEARNGPSEGRRVPPSSPLTWQRERTEGDRVDQGECAQEQPLGSGKAGGLDVRAEGEAGELIKKVPARGDDAVGEFAGGGEPRVEALLVQCFVNGARAAGDAAVGADQLH